MVYGSTINSIYGTKKFGNSLAMRVPQLNMVVMLKEVLIISTGFRKLIGGVMAKFDLNDSSVVCIIGSGAGVYLG